MATRVSAIIDCRYRSQPTRLPLQNCRYRIAADPFGKLRAGSAAATTIRSLSKIFTQELARAHDPSLPRETRSLVRVRRLENPRENLRWNRRLRGSQSGFGSGHACL